MFGNHVCTGKEVISEAEVVKEVANALPDVLLWIAQSKGQSQQFVRLSRFPVVMLFLTTTIDRSCKCKLSRFVMMC